MLFEPKWEVKADPFSLESLIAWLEKMPAEKEYNWASANCLLCQYLAEKGRNPMREYRLFNLDLRCDVAQARPWTFGAALERARKLLP
jgi:hypothetical protein